MSVIVMMVSMYITKPVEFSTFPTTLLLLTLFRLALNISSSRLILLNGNSGTSAAGHVIEAFGNSDPILAAAANIWRNAFTSEEEVYRKGIDFIRARL